MRDDLWAARPARSVSRDRVRDYRFGGSLKETMPQYSDDASPAPMWAIVLAGGEGVRLRPLVRELCGDERPKQFAKIVGSKSLLGHTLDRVGLKIPPSRTVISACRAHDGYLAQEFPRTPAQRILAQPQDHGTA